MLVGCIAAVLFVFWSLRDSGGVFAGPPDQESGQGGSKQDPPSSGAGPARSATDGGETVAAPPPKKPAAETDGEAEVVAPDPKSAAKETDPKEPAPTEPEGLDEVAQLTLEIVAPAAEKERAVTAYVKDRLGEPLDDVLVVFRWGESILYRERTDHEGRAIFQPWPEEKGPFRVDGIAHGFLTASARSVAAGGETELVMMARPSVSGIVRAPSRGQGLVKLFTEYGERETKIAADGSFVFENLEPGSVTVQAVVPPYGAASQSFYLQEGAQQEVQLRVRRKGYATIFGRIQFWPGKGKLWINGVAVPVTHQGSYKFDKAVPGENILLVDAPDKAPLLTRFNVKAGQSTRYNFSLHREGSIKGTVISGSTRRAVPNAEVRIGINLSDPKNREIAPYFPIERVPVVHTDRDGKFEIERLDSQLTYQVSVVHQDFGQSFGEYTATGGRIRLEMPEGPFVFGKIRGLGGVPRDAIVTAIPLEKQVEGLRFNIDNWNRSRSQRNRRGLYGLSGLLPGTYLVRVDAPGFGSIETVLDLTDATRRSRVDLRVRRGDDRTDDEAELLERLPPVVLTDEDADEPGFAPNQTTLIHFDLRRPINEVAFPAVRVVLFDEEGNEFHPQLEFDRLQFDLYGLPEAKYRAILQHPSLKKPWVQDNIELKRGEPQTIALPK